MEANTILHADVLDILFEGRNKDYGAYELRKTYNKRIRNAIAITIVVCLLPFVLSLFASSKKFPAHQFVIAEVNLSKVDDQPHEVIKPPLIKERVQVATKKDTPPVIVPDRFVKPEDILAPVTDLENVRIGTIDQGGKDVGDEVAAPLNESTQKNLSLSKKDETDEEIFIVQKEAQFPGGIDAWTKYLQQNLRTEVPVDNGAPEGSYTVVVSFLVDKDGNISEVQALNDLGYGTAEEAVRVIKKSKQWTPAIQNGRNVIYRQQQSITFVVQGQ